VAHHDAVAAKPAQPETPAARGHEARRVEA
jgi:hypothetical protein